MLSLLDIQCPSSFLIKSMLFLLLLITVDKWKNLVFSFAKVCYFVLAFCLQRISSLFSHSYSSRHILASSFTFSGIGSFAWISFNLLQDSLIFDWIFPKHCLFHLQNSCFVTLILLHTLKSSDPWILCLQDFSTTKKKKKKTGFVPGPCFFEFKRPFNISIFPF